MSAVRNAAALERAWPRCREEARRAFGRDALYVERLVERARHVEVQVAGDGSGRGRRLRRARVQPPAAAPEGRRDRARPEPRSRTPRSDRRRRPLARAGGPVREPRDVRVPGGRGRRRVLHRGQSADPGRAHGDRRARGGRPRPAPARARGGRAAPRGTKRHPRPRLRGAGAGEPRVPATGRDGAPGGRRHRRVRAARPAPGCAWTRAATRDTPRTRASIPSSPRSWCGPTARPGRTPSRQLRPSSGGPSASSASPGSRPTSVFSGTSSRTPRSWPAASIPGSWRRTSRPSWTATARSPRPRPRSPRRPATERRPQPWPRARRGARRDEGGRGGPARGARAREGRRAGPSRDAVRGGPRPAPAPAPGVAEPGAILAPMQGTVIEMFVGEGDPIHLGRELLVMEAMKMQHVIAAERSGRVRRLVVREGDTVAEGSPLLVLDEGEVAPPDAGEGEDLDLDAIRPDLGEVLERQALTRDDRRPDAVERRRRTGQRTARENVDDLVDEGSFIEYGALVVAARRQRHSMDELVRRTPADGLVAGIGRVNGRLFGDERARCLVMAYDYTVLAGTQGKFNHQKKDRMFALAEKWRLPMVFFAEGGGGRPRRHRHRLRGGPAHPRLPSPRAAERPRAPRRHRLRAVLRRQRGGARLLRRGDRDPERQHRHGGPRDDRGRGARRLPARGGGADGRPGPERGRGHPGRGRGGGGGRRETVPLVLPGPRWTTGRAPTSGAFGTPFPRTGSGSTTCEGSSRCSRTKGRSSSSSASSDPAW